MGMISMVFDSKDHNIQILTYKANAESAPNELGLPIRTQNAVFYNEEIHT